LTASRRSSIGLAILVGIPTLPPDLKLAIAVFLGFVSVHVLLLLGTFDIYDLEETEYGNVAVAVLDGQIGATGYVALSSAPEQGDALMSGAGRRRRTIWSMEPTVVPFFVALGPTMLALKLWALFGVGLWAAIWALVARRVTPRAPIWVILGLFVLPLPLIQRAALTAISITAHLGSSAWHGLVLLLALGALTGRSNHEPSQPPSRRPRAWLAASGLVAGWGLYCSMSLAPLLLGVVYIAWRVEGRKGVAVWGAATLPGLAVLYTFRDVLRRGGTDLVTKLTGLSPESAFREGGSLGESLVGSVIYWPGFVSGLRFEEGPISQGYYDAAWSAAYGVTFLAVIAAGMAFGRRARRRGEVLPSEESTSVARIACWLSFGGFYGTFLYAGFVLDPSFFDGLRYLLPMAPAPLLLAGAAASRLPPRTGVGAIALLLVGHAIGFGLLFQPSVFPAPWSSLVGYEPVVMKAWMTGPLEPGSVDPDRAERWTTWAAVSAARRGPEEAAGRSAPAGVDAEVFRRGLGLGLGLSHPGEEPWLHPTDAALMEGAAWGTAYAGCSSPTRKALLAAAEDDEAVWYGIGRAELYCRTYLGRMDETVPEEHLRAFQRGLRDAWEKDYTVPGIDSPPGLRPPIRIY
jgi:hypothetical protein